MIFAPEAAKLDKGRLGNAQKTIINWYQQFFRMLTDAIQQADEESKKRFAAVEQLLLSGKPENLLANAVENIDLAKPIGAVGSQEKALEILREALRILVADEEGLADLLKDLEQIIAELKKLKKDVEDSDKREFVTAQSQFEARQLEIG